MTKLLIDRAVVEHLALYCEANAESTDEHDTLKLLRAVLAQTEQPAQGERNTPFANCRFQICDLPGQCKGEGKCHHPAALLQSNAEPVNQALLDALKGAVTLFACRCSDATAANWLFCAEKAIAQAQPAKREPLTDFEIDSLTDHISLYVGKYEHAIARAIEAAHGITTGQQ
jgi:hypothetical protein